MDDFNRDGVADLAVTDYGSDTVMVLLGRGDGTFQAAVNYAVGRHPWSVAAGDFDADGRADLVVANGGSNTVSVLLGNGDGTFQAARDFPAGLGPFSVAVNDFDGDGKPDLVVANSLGGTVSVLLGNGDGTFRPAVNYAVGTEPRSVAVADFNGDGKPDLAVANTGSNTISVLLGNGDGTFQAAQTFAAGASPWSVTAGDFDNDGKLDLAVANFNSADVSVLLGNGNGTFRTAVSYASGTGSLSHNHPESVRIGDFNGDGKPDLTVANDDASVSVLLGRGDGTFQAARTFWAHIHPASVAVGDFNRDGKADLAVANFDSGDVSVLLGNGDGTLQAPSVPPILTVIKAGTGSGTVTSSLSGIDCGTSCSANYSSGTTVTLSATPGADSTFAGWSGACSGTGTCTVTTTAITFVTADFDLRQGFALTVIKAGTGSGTVTSTLPGINCGAICSATYPSGTTVTLTAAPSAGSTFAGWSGACSGTGTCTSTMTGPTTVTATFIAQRFTLTVAPTGMGSGRVTSSPAGIDCGAMCSAAYDSGTVVILTATPAGGSTFTGWSGAGCAGTGACTVTVTASTTVTATFDVQRFALTVVKAGTGSGTVTSTLPGIDCGTSCSATYPSGTTVTLTATPGAGSTFSGWSGSGGCVGTGTCAVTMTGATVVTATFDTQRVTLTVSKTGTGSGMVGSNPAGIDCGAACVAAYNIGTVVTLAATPATGATLVGWSGGGCSGTGPCAVTLTAATTVTATFTAPLGQFGLSVSLRGSASGTVTSTPSGITCGTTCAALYSSGTNVTLTASAGPGAFFKGWVGGGCTGTAPCTVAMIAMQSVSAIFSAVFTNPTPTGVIRAADIMDLRFGINTLRAQNFGLAPVTFTDPTIAGGVTPVKAIHVTELRAALDDAYVQAGLPPPGYTDSTLTPGVTPIKAIHLDELQNAVRRLE